MVQKHTTVSVTPEVRNRLRLFKRAGVSYSVLLTAMMDQFDPEEFYDEYYDIKEVEN